MQPLLVAALAPGGLAALADDPVALAGGYPCGWLPLQGAFAVASRPCRWPSYGWRPLRGPGHGQPPLHADNMQGVAKATTYQPGSSPPIYREPPKTLEVMP
ncbi:hypothetical protein BHE74_00045926 [Ensete ventricosum]|nr:hypothetical protein GW17_00043373 [Ensete ventricosum]RWW48044.1 hypothetical protein BHE74_00045926 [Ensete ventricosum]RZS20601.1 hypothetical protein BHM03_00053133 [Ensete ventricosum]